MRGDTGTQIGIRETAFALFADEYKVPVLPSELSTYLATIGERLGPFDLSMIEIGAANPAWADIHLGPVYAGRAFAMLGGQGALLPIHWATFDLGLHPWAEPAEAMLVVAEQAGIRLLTPRIGEPFEPSTVGQLPPWWREVTGTATTR